MKVKLLVLILAAGLLSFSIPDLFLGQAVAAEISDDTAVAVVRGFIDDMVAATKSDAESAADKDRRLHAIFVGRFDVPSIARFVLGRHWRLATISQQEEFTDLFEALIVRTYGSRFTDRSRYQRQAGAPEPFHIVGSRSDGADNTLVTSQVMQPGVAKPTRIDWRVARAADGTPKLTDVVIEGISLRMSYQADFGSTIQRSGGIDGLLGQLRSHLG